MSQLIAMRVRIADVDKSEELNEVWRQPLPHDVPFTTAQRLLGWLRGEVGVISTTQVRRWVQHHGQLIRQAEQVEVQAVLEHESLSDWQAGLAPRQAPRRPAAREQTFNEAMEHALAQPDPSPPAGVSASDWECVRQARPDETEVERLRRLGPLLQPGEMVAVTSEVGPMHAHGLSPAAQTGFNIDIEQGPHCGGTLTIIAASEPPTVMAQILAQLGWPIRAPPRAPARPFDSGKRCV